MEEGGGGGGGGGGCDHYVLATGILLVENFKREKTWRGPSIFWA